MLPNLLKHIPHCIFLLALLPHSGQVLIVTRRPLLPGSPGHARKVAAGETLQRGSKGITSSDQGTGQVWFSAAPDALIITLHITWYGLTYHTDGGRHKQTNKVHTLHPFLCFTDGTVLKVLIPVPSEHQADGLYGSMDL